MSAPNPTITISAAVARRFLLERQGLWPKRRWRGSSGTLSAVRELGSVQMDPLTIVARSHDLVLWSRIVGYRPRHLDDLLYVDRSLFDYGGVLRIQPVEELPHWRLHMERRRGNTKYYTPLATEHPALFEEVRSIVERDGPLPAKELTRQVKASAGYSPSAPTTKTGSYRSQSVVNRVAYQLWMTGELVTHHREGFERHYDLADRIAPKKLYAASNETTARTFFAEKVLKQAGLITPGTWHSSMSYLLHRKIERTEAAGWIDELLAEGSAVSVAVEGHRGRYLVSGDAMSNLQDLANGAVPADWGTKRSLANPQVRLLSPLDPIVKAERAKAFFDFEHLWEIYKPAAKRRWGPFTMPILYGDALVGRVDPRMDRDMAVLHVNGLWLETPDLTEDTKFTAALAREIQSLATFLGAEQIRVHASEPTVLRKNMSL